MPTKNRRLWVRKKAQIGFREKKNLQDATEIDFLIRLAQTHLESVRTQAYHLQQWLDDEPRGKGEKLPPSQEYITTLSNKYMENRVKMEEEKKQQKEEKAKQISDDILV